MFCFDTFMLKFDLKGCIPEEFNLNIHFDSECTIYLRVCSVEMSLLSDSVIMSTCNMQISYPSDWFANNDMQRVMNL